MNCKSDSIVELFMYIVHCILHIVQYSALYLRNTVVYKDRGDGDVAADPVGDVRPVGPESVGVVPLVLII